MASASMPRYFALRSVIARRTERHGPVVRTERATTKIEPPRHDGSRRGLRSRVGRRADQSDRDASRVSESDVQADAPLVASGSIADAPAPRPRLICRLRAEGTRGRFRRFRAKRSVFLWS